MRQSRYSLASITTDSSPKTLMSKAQQHISNNRLLDKSIYWLVFDKDAHENLESVFKSISMLSNRQKNKVNINIAFNSICFETFMLLHYEYTTRSFHNCNELCEYIKKTYMKNYAKNDLPTCTSIIANYETARLNSIKLNKWVSDNQHEISTYQRNPWTDVYLLFDFLRDTFEPNA